MGAVHAGEGGAAGVSSRLAVHRVCKVWPGARYPPGTRNTVSSRLGPGCGGLQLAPRAA